MAYSSDFSTSNQYIKYNIEMIQNSQDVAGNYSNVTVRVWFWRTNGYESYGTGTVYVNINGGAYSASVTTAQKITSTKIMLFEKTLNIAHNGDGTGRVDAYAYISHSVVTSSNQGWGFGLTTIPRASTPTLSSTNFNMGSAITIYTNKLASFTHTVVVTFGGYQANIAFDVVDSVSWTPDTALMAPQIPNATAGIGSITLHTYSGTTLIGSKSVGFTANLPTSVVPTFTSVTHAEATTTPDIKTIVGSYVQNMSALTMTINGASGVYGSSITNYKFNIDGVDYNGSGNVQTSNAIKSSGTVVLTATITDSRGRTAVKTANVTVLAYEPPKVTTFSLDRANSDGTLNAMGTSVKVTRNVTFTTLNSKNTLTIVVKSKARGVSTWTTNNTSTAYTTTPQNGSLVVGTFTATTSYDFMVEFKDKFNTTITLGVVSTGQVTMSWGKTGIGIGKVWEAGALDIAGDINVAGHVNLGTYQMKGRLGSERIPASADLNTYTTEGLYYCPLNSDVTTITNRPPTGMAFSLLVERTAGTKQTLTTYMTTGWTTWVRNNYTTSWGPWVRVQGEDPLLFAGSGGGQNLTPSTWARADFATGPFNTGGQVVNSGSMFNDSTNLFLVPEEGWYNLTYSVYINQSVNTGYYCELWGNPSDPVYVLSAFCPANGWNYLYGSNIAYLYPNRSYEFVIKQTDGSYTRTVGEHKMSVTRLMN